MRAITILLIHARAPLTASGEGAKMSKARRNGTRDTLLRQHEGDLRARAETAASNTTERVTRAIYR